MVSKLNSIKIITVLSIIFYINSLPIVKRLQPGQAFCFSDDVPQHTLIKLKTFISNPVQMQIYASHRIIKNIQIHGQSLQSWTTQSYGIYKFCFKNYQSIQSTLKYDYAIGQRAKDYTSSYQGKDYLKSLQSQANIAAYFAEEIQRENTEGLKIIMDQNLEANSYACVYMLSTFFVAVTVVLTYVQFKMVKKHLHNRKYL